MKILNKQWAQVLKEVREVLTAERLSEATRIKLAWIEERANEAHSGNALAAKALNLAIDCDDLVGRKMESVSQKSARTFFKLEGRRKIVVENLVVLEDEIGVGVFSESIFLKAVELYALSEGGIELHFLFEGEKGEAYLTLGGTAIEVA